MGSEARARKLADRIKVIVAQTLDSRVKDPRLGFITITDVRLTADLRDASIFYTVLGTEEERQSTAAALASSKGMLRTRLVKEPRQVHPDFGVYSRRHPPRMQLMLNNCSGTPQKLTLGFTPRQKTQNTLVR